MDGFSMVHWQQYSCYKAQEYYQQIINAGVDLPAKFEVANGWLKRFQEWFEKQYQEKVHQSIYQQQKMVDNKYKCYPLGDIYNAAEMGLFFQLGPDKTLASKSNTVKG